MGYRVNTPNLLWAWRLVSLTCLTTIPACSWFGQERDSPRFGVISVRLQSPSKYKKAVTYAKASAEGSKQGQSDGVQRISPDGGASFVVRMGAEYDVCIFADLNRNQAPDSNEPAATAGRLIPTPPASVISPVTLAFGYDGPVHAPEIVPPPASNSVPAVDESSNPSAADSHMDRIPLWLREQIATSGRYKH
jgi:hypothetical protein